LQLEASWPVQHAPKAELSGASLHATLEELTALLRPPSWISGPGGRVTAEMKGGNEGREERRREGWERNIKRLDQHNVWEGSPMWLVWNFEAVY